MPEGLRGALPGSGLALGTDVARWERTVARLTANAGELRRREARLLKLGGV